ncbi:Mfa1 family fimbria major subunit [Phocaeicola sartorii]|uniref:Mfa1 family fimbria major subunit n=1 Tax=Phocaeicola sartorii TaxID=671267 RepID=UPI00248D28CE|nr:Mfa1 family fimbria major subunit [Phocaeicola sartorii]
MKKRSFLLAGLAALFMASCSDNDLPQGNEQQIVEKDGKMYMKVEINNANGSGSRAVEYEDGDSNLGENDINEILFVFYNENKNYVGDSRLRKKKSDADVTPGDGYDGFLGDLKDGSGSSAIENVMVTIVPVEVTAGSFVPQYVMAYVNPTSQWSENVKTPLKDFKEIKRTSYRSDGVNNEKFLMNNAVYYEGEGNTLPTTLAKITGTLYETEEKANANDATTSVTINVERVAAKVKVSAADGFNKENNADNDGYVNTHTTNYSVKFVPKCWALNAVATSTYLVKQFLKNDDATNLFYSDMPAFAATSSIWNDKENKRSYWCTSQFHHSGTYPSVFSEASDKSLKYYSWKELLGENGVGKTLTKDGNVDYCMEHTVDANTLSKIGEGALTSVMVIGQYQLKKDNQEVNDGKPITFYTYGKPVDGKYNIYLENDILVPMAANQNVIYYMSKSGENPEYQLIQKKEGLTAIDYAKIFKVFYPSGDVKVPGRYRFLGLVDNLPIEGEYYYKKADQKFEKLTNENWNSVKDELTAQLRNSTEAAEMYTNGMAYFNIPIQHFGGVSSGYGSFGVVRNHYYKINITGISGLGTAISDEEHPIVPPRETLTYYVRTQLNVLSWRVMSQEDVTLK